MGIEENLKSYSYFSFETTDEDVFERIRKKLKIPTIRTWIDIGSRKEDLLDYFCLDIYGRDQLILAMTGEVGNYDVYARKEKEHKKSKLIFEHRNYSKN